MADNQELYAGDAGSTFEAAADDIAGVKHQRVKIQHGADGSATDVSTASPLPVDTSYGTTNTAPFSRFLDTNGDGTGTKNAVGDYSGSPADTQFYIQPGAGVIFHIARLIVTVEDTSGFTASEYGNLGSALSTGISIEKRQSGSPTTLIDFTDGLPVKTNAWWAGFCYDADLKTWGAGNELLVVRWTFDKTGAALRLDGDSSERLSVVLNDSFAGLVSHYFLVQGHTV